MPTDPINAFLPLLIEMDKKLDIHRHELSAKIDLNQAKQDLAAERLSAKIDALKLDIEAEVKELQGQIDKSNESITAHDHTIGWINKTGITAGLALITSLVTTAMGWWGHGK